MKPKSDPSTWPRLSVTLPTCVSPLLCQKCQSSHRVQTWIEHDAADQPERKFVVLCRQCSDAIIPPHPRLYAEAPVNAPIPGVMAICFECIHRQGTACICPAAKFNGGAGIQVTAAKPLVCHIDGRDPKSGKRFGRWIHDYSTPPSACTGRKTA
jgi:hypothetical protein